MPNDIIVARQVLRDESNRLSETLPTASDAELLDLFENACYKAVNLSAGNQLRGMIVGIATGGPEIWINTYHRELVCVWYCNFISTRLSEDFCERYHLLISRSTELSDLQSLKI